jgi:predicted DNA-binding transcriptional regulator YafY
MDSNTHSTGLWTGASAGTPGGLSAVVAELQCLADQPLGSLADAARAERIMALRGLAERLEGQWLAELAASVGRVSEATIRRYIAEQTTRPTKGMP